MPGFAAFQCSVRFEYVLTEFGALDFLEAIKPKTSRH